MEKEIAKSALMSCIRYHTFNNSLTDPQATGNLSKTMLFNTLQDMLGQHNVRNSNSMVHTIGEDRKKQGLQTFEGLTDEQDDTEKP